MTTFSFEGVRFLETSSVVHATMLDFLFLVNRCLHFIPPRLFVLLVSASREPEFISSPLLPSMALSASIRVLFSCYALSQLFVAAAHIDQGERQSLMGHLQAPSESGKRIAKTHINSSDMT